MKVFKIIIHWSICLFVLMILQGKEEIWAYGETINGFQTHYEIQNQYLREDYLIIEGFYYVYELQNFTSNTGDNRTHYYYLQLNNGSVQHLYYDTGGYTMDLTEIEYKSGYPWASVGESDIVGPGQSAYNYRYRDIGFQFAIPLSDLRDFQGTQSKWNLEMTCVALNTYQGRGVEMVFVQQNIYASQSFDTLYYEDYSILPYSELARVGSNIIADVGYVRTGPGKGSDILKIEGKNLYWGYQETFWDLSRSYRASLGSDAVTWYSLEYGEIYHDGLRYRARYAGSGNFGWIPSVFMGSISGTPYAITILNTPPEIQAEDITLPEGTQITESLLFTGVSAYDYSFGTKVPSISSTDLILDSTNNRPGKYSVTYYARDGNMAETFKTIRVTIENIPPELEAYDKEIYYGEKVTIEFLMQGVTAFDIGDGDLSSGVFLYKTEGLILDSEYNENGVYPVTYGVEDSNGASVYKTVNVTVVFAYIRSISNNTLQSLSVDSKWRSPGLSERLIEILRRQEKPEEYEQVWEFSDQTRQEIQEYMQSHSISEESNQWFLERYRDCRIK